MIPVRHSAATLANPDLRELRPRRGETNRQWLRRMKAGRGIVLIGGSSLAHFRIRVAQSHLRSDLLPSFWSLAGILEGTDAFYSVPLDLRQEASEVPQKNGVQRCRIQDYDDPDLFPNIAVIDFPGIGTNVPDNIAKIEAQRSILDVPGLMLPWLGFVWGAGNQGNPLLQGIGLPSAAFVEAVYSIDRVDLTPGISAASSCPEAIWQSAKWWRGYYEETNGAQTDGAAPSGRYALRQPAAAALDPDRSAQGRRR